MTHPPINSTAYTDENPYRVNIQRHPYGLWIVSRGSRELADFDNFPEAVHFAQGHQR